MTVMALAGIAFSIWVTFLGNAPATEYVTSVTT